ncbi:tape measure protein [Elizabethkingia anophelis]|nr:tape measure protein [Elizabethkingia anophelis]
MNNNTVDFIIRMKDLMSSGLNRLSSTSQAAFNRMRQHAENQARRNRVLGMSYNEIQRRIRDVENTIRNSTIPNQIRNARRELEQLQRMANRHPGSPGGGGGSGGGIGTGGIALGSMMGNMLTQVATSLLSALKDGIGKMLSGTMQKEQDIVGLTTFLGKKGATEAYGNIRKDADVTPYDTASLLMVNRSLIAAGLNAKDAREDTMNLANAISAVGGGNAELSRMALNMQQIKTVGKASAIDIKQFGYVGINIYKMLAESTGKTIEQVKEMDVTYEQLARALSMARGKGGIYEGALEAQGQTMAGKWSTVKDKFDNALVDIGDKFAPIINKVLDLAIKVADSIAPLLAKAQPYIDFIAEKLGMAIDYVVSMTDSSSQWADWIEIAANWYSQVGSLVGGILSDVIKMVVSIIDWLSKSELIKDVIRIVHWFLIKCLEIVKEITAAFQDVWENGLKPILEGLNSAYKSIKGFFGLGGNEPVKVEAKKILVAEKPASPYQFNLTRFGKTGGAIGDGDEKAKKNKDRSKKAGDTIAGGGPRVINISVGKFFDNLNFNTLNTKESTDKLESLILECLGRTLYEGAKVM